MKKGISISLVLLMVAALLHLSVAVHYCGGKEVASKVSLTGHLASCGMESPEKGLPLHGTNFTNHCCNDVVIICGIVSNYTPSFSFVPEYFQYSFHIFAFPAEPYANLYTDLIPLYSDVNPPGELMSTSVDQSDICVFRI
jgi:hypothetical protein